MYNTKFVIVVAPLITCDDLSMKVDEHDSANFRCRVKADPPTDSVFWRWNSTGSQERLNSGDNIGQVKTYITSGVSTHQHDQ